MSPARQPAGSVQMMRVGSPASPGLLPVGVPAFLDLLHDRDVESRARRGAIGLRRERRLHVIAAEIRWRLSVGGEAERKRGERCGKQPEGCGKAWAWHLQAGAH